MSEYSPGTFQLADRVVEQTVHAAHREAASYRLLCKVNAQCGQLSRNKRGVRIDNGTEQQLGADRYYFGFQQHALLPARSRNDGDGN